MSVAQFLDAVLPTQGHRFALSAFGKQGDEDFRPGQKHFTVGNTADIISYGAWGSNNGANAYFAVGGFITGPNGVKRTANCAQYHRCLRLDLDVSTHKPNTYRDKRSALLGLFSFVQHYGLPDPWIVDSGGGYHVYWAFDRDVYLAEWVPMAGRLRAACEAFGLLSDTTCTTDAARILRLPGTLNNKPEYVAAGNPPTVRIVQVGVAAAPEQIVGAFPSADLVYTNAQLPASLRGGQDELQANLHQPYFLRGVLTQCPGLSAMVADGGANAPEPLWKATLDLINKSDETDELKMRVARGLSAGHPGFSEESLQRKWQQVLEQDYHPPTCTRMAGAGMAACGTCPFKGKISSPLVLGRYTPVEESDATVKPLPAPTAEPPAAAYSVPPPPTGSAALVAAPPTQVGVFIIDSSTTVRVTDGRLTSRLLIADGYPTQMVEREPDANGNKTMYNKRMLDYRLLRVERMLDSVGKRSVVVLSFERAKDGQTAIEFDNRDFAETKSFFNKMNAAGLYCSKKAAVEFVDKFMTEFLSQLQRARAASQIANRCGWSEDLSAFVLGTQIYRNDGTSESIRTGTAPGEMEGYHAAGDESQWRDAFDIVLAGGPDRQCILALALAGPLMVFTGLDGVLINAYSPESGVGKSTLCDAALSIWGSPNVLRKDFRDTANATFKLASVTGNMPLVIDEFTNVEGKALSDYIYTLTQGREKHRLGADARLTHTDTQQRWCLAAVATANNSVHEKLQAYRADATAEAARVFEMRLHPLNIDPEKMGSIKGKLLALRHSYGFLGPRLVQLFLSKPSEYWRQAVMTRIAKWDRDTSQSASDRFRSATCALIEVGAALGAALGYAFQPKLVEEELRRHWRKQVAEFDAERKTPFDFLNSYVLENVNEFAMIGGPNGDSLINPNNVRRFRGEIRGKTAPGGGFRPTTVMIPLDPLRNYVRDCNGNYKAVVEWLQSSPMVVRMGRLPYLKDTTFEIVTNVVELRHADVMGSSKPTLSIVPTDPAPTQEEKKA